MWVKDNTGKLIYGAIAPETRKVVGILQQMVKDRSIDGEFVVTPQEVINEDLVGDRCGLYYGAQWSPLFPLQKAVDSNPRGKWECSLIPHSGGGIARSPYRPSPENFKVIRKGFSNPEVIFKLANMGHEYLESPRQQAYYHSEVSQKLQLFFLSLAGAGEPFGNYKIALRLKPALEQRNPNLPGIYDIDKKLYYNYIMKYVDGDISGWGYWKVFGPEGTQLMYKPFIEGKLWQTNAFYGKAVKAWVEKGMTLEKLRDEEVVKVIVGEKPLSYFDDFVTQWYATGGQEATDQVNAWYQRKLEERADTQEVYLMKDVNK
jgi:putative aldouronate transport system substrate-binding protein